MMQRSTGRRPLVFCLAFLALVARAARAEDDLLALYFAAQEHDPVYQQAKLERDIAVQGMREARAGNGPSLTMGIEASQIYQDIRESDNFLFQTGKSDFVDQRFELSLTQPIYRAETLRRLPQGHAQMRRAEAALAAAEQELMVRLAEAVFNAMAARDILEFATAERAAIGRQVEESEQRLTSGLAKITDVHDGRARYEDSVAREIEAQDAMAEARLIIAEITGREPSQLGSLRDGFPLVGPDPPEREAWVRTALFQNHRLESLREIAEVARYEVDVQKAARVPTVTFVASYTGSESGGSVFLGGGGSQILNTNVGIRLGIPIYDSGLWSSRAQAASLRHQATLQDIEREKGRLERETQVAFQGVVSGITRVRALQQAVFSQERALESTEESFRAGLGTGRAVLDSRRDLFSVQRDHSLARYVYVLSTLRLQQATGALGLQQLQRVSANIQ